MTQKDTIFIGIDVGGTRCQASAYSVDGRLLAQAHAPSVNLGVDALKVISALDQVLAKLSHLLGLPVTDMSIGIGCAGFSHVAGRERLLKWVQAYSFCHITSDIHIASIAANAGADCAVVIAGTGTCGATYQHKQLHQIGGHGLLLGDHGSGAWLGLQAVKHLLAVSEGCSLPTLLSSVLSEYKAEQTKNDSSASLTTVQYNSHDFASLAPYVFSTAQQGDTCALDIIETGLGHINTLVNRVSENQTLPVFYVGGVLQPYLTIAQEFFPQHALLQTDLKPCTQPPEYGAMLFARHCNDDSNDDSNDVIDAQPANINKG